MPRCYMVKKGSQRHEGGSPRSPTEASIAPPCYSPHTNEPNGGGASIGVSQTVVGGEYVSAGWCGERSAADTEAAHDLLSLAQSLPPLPPPAAVLTVLAPDPPPVAPVLPLYTYTIQPASIFIVTDQEPYPQPYPHTYSHPYPQPYPQPAITVPDLPIEYADPPIYTTELVDVAIAPAFTPAPALESPPVAPAALESPVEPELEPPVATGLEPVIEPAPEPTPEVTSDSEPQFEPTRRVVLKFADPEPGEPKSIPTPVIKHGSKQKPRYDCGECGKRYATSSNLSRHKQTHRSLDSVAAKRCGECGKAYVSMPALAMHVLTHRMGHLCRICGKQFSRPWLLRGHQRSHTGEKPYSCSYCGKSFADRSNLRAHLQTHSHDKKYECDRCRKNFALKSYLHKHQESGCTRD